MHNSYHVFQETSEKVPSKGENHQTTGVRFGEQHSDTHRHHQLSDKSVSVTDDRIEKLQEENLELSLEVSSSQENSLFLDGKLFAEKSVLS